MFLLELVMQGVRGIRELARLRFQPAFNIISAGNEKGKTTSVDTIKRLLFPDDRREVIAPLVSYHTPDASRAALVIAANDGAYYRVIQDFSKSGVNLAKYDAATKQFVLIRREWRDAAEFMSALTAGMKEDEFGSIFIFRRDSLEHRLDAAPSVSASIPAAGLSPVSKEASAAQKERLAELREQLRKAEEAADEEYRLESAKIKLGEISKRLEAIEENEERFSHLRAEMEALKGCETLPENLTELLDAHEQIQAEKMIKCDELQRDIDGLKAQFDRMPKAKLLSDPLFIAGAVLGAASIIAGIFILTLEYADYFPIGVLASLLLVSAGWYNASRKNAQRRLVLKNIEELEAELAEVEKNFGEGGAAIMAYMQATGSATTAELREKADNYRHFRSLLREADEEMKRLLGGVTKDMLRAEYAKQQQEVIELERRLSMASHRVVDAYSIRQEIERLESETEGSHWGGVSFEGALDISVPVFSQGAGREGVFLPELHTASRASGIEMEALVPAVEAAAQRNFAAVTAGRYLRLDAGHDGEPAVYDSNDRKIGFSDLSHGTKKLLYLCLRAGLVEALVGKLRMPFLLDDPFAGLDPARQNAACHVLRQLASKTQVILFTSNPAVRADGDAFIELK